MEDNAMNSNCCQYKLGLQVSNKGVVIMAGKLETQMKREIAIMTEAKDWFKKYVMAWIPETLAAKDSKAKLEFVLQCWAPGEKILSYNTRLMAMEHFINFWEYKRKNWHRQLW